MDPKQRVRGMLGSAIFVGIIAAGVLGYNVPVRAGHLHCTDDGSCQDIGCTENHPGFSCHVTDDNNCRCIVPPAQ